MKGGTRQEINISADQKSRSKIEPFENEIETINRTLAVHKIFTNALILKVNFLNFSSQKFMNIEVSSLTVSENENQQCFFIRTERHS